MCLRYAKDKDEANVCLNNGFLRIFKNLEKLEKIESVEPWMRRIMFNSISDHLRSKAGKVRFLEIEQNGNSTNNEGYQGLLEDDILRLIDLLPRQSGEVFVLYAIHGYKHKEIAELKGISEGTSKWHLSEAKKKLQNLIIKSRNRNIDVG